MLGEERPSRYLSPHNPRFDIFHGLAKGGVAKVALRDLKEAGTEPAGLKKFDIFEGGNAVVEAASQEDT